MTTTEPHTDIDVRPLAGYTGAEIHGIDLSRPLSDHERTAITDALATWKVVFFRDQDLDHARHVAFGREFGEVTRSHPYTVIEPSAEFPQIGTIDIHQGGSYGYGPEHDKPWHTDISPLINPPAASILRADVVPPYGGDTQWSNLVAAYDGLSAPVKELADTLRAVHVFPVPAIARDEDSDGFAAGIQARPLESIHPVVRVHPLTGEKVLFVNPGFTRELVGVSPKEGRHLLDLFFEQIDRPEYTVRFKWEPGSVAFWDNRATVHRIPGDVYHLEHPRILHRITLVGDVPVGVDGEASESISGEPFLAA